MEFADELLPGARFVRLKRFDDARGSFVKTFSRSLFEAAIAGMPGGEPFELSEEFYSTSARDVIRGMHFQVPPHDHVKLVYCASGAVLDVLVDLRRGPGYGKVASVRLDAAAPSLLVIPKGVAHGFRSLTDDSLMVYKTSTEHSPAHDQGIRWDSLDFAWDCPAPVISARDRAHPPLAEFESPF
ncbi:dTDP-4-dehydrorhamnose 3,5-epimerase family protein [Piscinibacter koreensis]|uniref:dTDP-4-dehydrorhamnose 3,5-epimerase n=1 Tax=Piscinibacter koreensis TaxID=2742824 RepID=A0A7Y6NRV0_9BURK|nr:dTDP-4-dehydrorhamnose 3,5-epimerase [Schlegelella koreensis]NUZ08202.1 dTDP-4-dehydrorhamnose 3,5-epimerase family protein [Schlegelella koreensis]